MQTWTFRRGIRALDYLVLAGVTLLVVAGAKGADCAPAPSGLLGWWAGEGGGGDTMGLNPGGVQGNVVFQAGRAGQGFSFDGTNAYIQVADAVALSPQAGERGELTLEAWVRMERLPQYHAGTAQPFRAIVVKGSAGQWEYGFIINTNAEPRFQAWQLNGNVYGGTTGPALTLNQWHHLAGVIRKGQFVRLYVNGQLVSEATSFSGDCTGGTAPLYIGRRGDGQNFDGQVDEVSLYGRALSATEIAAVFDAGSAGKCPTFAATAAPYWTDFENGAGPEWMRRDVNGAELLGFTRFSGRFQNGFQMLTLTNLVVGQSYTVGFDFYPLDSWDGGTSDYFEVRVNGASVFRYSYANGAATQTYPGQPDEGRSNYGFAQNYVDSIYRNLEVTFVATNSLSTISFAGQGLEAIANESWGLDNVSVQLASAITGTVVRSSTLPGHNTTSDLPIENFTISCNWPLLPSTATNAANYSLREAGTDGVLGNGDDVLFTLTASLPGAGGRSVALSPANAPLQAGRYRFQTTTGLQGTNGAAVPVFTREFYVVSPVVGSLETTSNNTSATPTPLPLTESPVGSGFFTAFASGTFSSTSDVDYWRFDAEAGDLLTVRLESESQGVSPRLRLRNTSDQDLASNDGGTAGIAQIQTFAITKPGTYLLRVWSTSNRSRYGMRVDLARGLSLESEDNATQAAANTLAMSFSAGLSQGRVAGALVTGDLVDVYRIGVLNAGNAISISTLYPTGSSLGASSTVIGVQLEGNPVALVTNTGASLNYAVVSDGVHFVYVTTDNPNLRAQYLLNVTVSDGVPPVVTGTSLPGEGVFSSQIYESFTLSFSEEMLPWSVTNSGNYELRSVGADGVFGTPDDALYRLAGADYSGGMSIEFAIVEGPLQPGRHRLTVSQSLADRALNPMAAPFVRTFTIANVPGMVLENRNNNAQGLGAWLSQTATGNADGTLAWIGNLSAGAYVEDLTTGFVAGNTNLALVAANYGVDTVTIYTNDGRAAFQVATNVAVGDGPVSAVLADLDGDGNADLVVANYLAGSLSILTGGGGGPSPSGTDFLLKTNLPGFSNPYFLSVGDLNADSKQDVVVANYGSSSISVLLGNGDGTFVRSNYTVGSRPYKAAIGDINGDGRPDLVSANNNTSSLTVLTNAGNGGFAAAVQLTLPGNPRYVAIADVTGDNLPDLVALQNAERTIAVFPGNGGTSGTLFQPYRSYPCSAQGAYSLLVTDLNQDGKPDVVVPGYDNDQIAFLYNDGAGVFTNLQVYASAQSPFAAVAGDFDNDGRPDVAVSHYHGPYISLWLGNAYGALAEDPPASGLRTGVGRGTLSDSADVDYFRFSGNAGDLAMVAVDVPGNPDLSSLSVQIRQADGGVLATFNSDRRGWGQSATVTLPYTGTYAVRVAKNHSYFGEYRIRVTVVRPPVQFEAEGNGTLATANLPVFQRVGNRLKATLAGCLSYADGADSFNLGNLVAGATVKLDTRQPSSSGLAQIISIYNAAGTLLTNTQAGAASFAFTVPPGQDGFYYVQLTPAPGGFGSSSAVGIGFNADGELRLGNWFNYQSFTISMWLNPAASQTTYADILDNNHRTAVSWVVQQDAAVVNRYVFGDTVAGVPFNLAPNQWQHLTLTRDTTNVLRVYLDGALVGTAGGSAQINYDGSQFLRVGAWGGGGRNWRGMVDDLRIWGKALTQPEVLASMSGTLTGNEADLLGYWPFNEGFGTTSADLTPANHPAVFAGNPYWAFLGPTNTAPAGLLSQYLLDIDLLNPVAPTVTAVSLPPEGTTNTSLLTSFTVNFSEDMDGVFTALARNILRYGGHTYFATDTEAPWRTLQSQAVALGGHLVAINDAAEKDWIVQNYSRYGTLWIGASDYDREGTWVWASGEPFTYANWGGSEPNNSNGVEDYAQMYTTGLWNDANGTQNLRGVVEVGSTADQDADGWVDILDPYPADPLNGFDLRAAGPDGQFDTTDDPVYRVVCSSYARGLSASFSITDGPLLPGDYRFRATTSLRSRFGITLAAPYVRFFTISSVSGFVTQGRRDTGGSSTTSLSASLVLDPAGTGLRTVAARGNVADSTDLDYWTFSAEAGQGLLLTTENPGYPSGSQLLYRLYGPDGGQWTYFYTDAYGRYQASLTVPASGTYGIRVEQYDSYAGEYRFRLTLADPPVQLETEDNGTLAAADPVTLSLSNGQRLATLLGCIPNWDNGDFYQFGNLGVGTQVKLEVGRPSTSSLGTRLELYKGSTLVAQNHPTTSNLLFTVDAGNQGAYSARISGAYPTHHSSITNALILDGSSAYVNLGSWSPGSKWSVQTWAMPASLPSGRRLIIGSAADYLDWGLVLQDGKFAALIRVPGGSVISLPAPETAVPGTWYHLAVACDGTNASLYVNGLLRASNPVDLNYTPTSSGTWLGGAVCCGGQFFPGALHDASIWKRALTQSEVLAFAGGGSSPFYPTGAESGLAGAWSLRHMPGFAAVPDLSTNARNGTLVNGAAYAGLAPVGSAGSGLLQQYLLGVTLLDTIPPQVLSVTLPGEGMVVSNVLDRFSISFSEDMTAAAVRASANYDLRSAGPDGLFLTPDDAIFAVSNLPAYVSGTSASYVVTDGPLQPGTYRFTVKATVTDTGGTPLAAPYVRNFSVVNVPGFVFDARANDSFATATSLSPNRANRANGSFVSGTTLGGLGAGLGRIAAGHLDGDTNLDVVAALWQSGRVAVLKGNGDGTFELKTNYVTGANAWSVALARFDSDPHLDLAVANHGANTVTVLKGNGDGTFAGGDGSSPHYPVDKNPHHVVAADLNRDGKTDLAVPNLGAQTISVLLGAGDGTFSPAVNFTVGVSPAYIAVGDVNGDQKPDLAVANYGGNNVSLLLGNGDGTFGAGDGSSPGFTIAAGYQPRAVALIDLNGDTRLDLAVFNGGDDTVSILAGNGDGTFQQRRNYPAGTSDGYELQAADLNLDGALDLVMAGANNDVVSVLFGGGDGSSPSGSGFLTPSTFAVGNRPRGLLVADLNNDGRLDLATGNDYGQNLSVLLGADAQPLALDPATGLRMAAGRGNIRDQADVDYWSFDALSGDRLLIATENAGGGSGSLLYRIYYPNGAQWTYFHTDGNGRAQVSLAVPLAGTYYIRAEFSDSYTGEYRLRITLALPPVQLEAENNNDSGRANSLTYELNSGHRQATVLGCLNTGDPGDLFRLGILSANSSISLGLRKPANAGFASLVEILDPSGALVAASALGGGAVSYVVPPGVDGSYFARVRAVPGILPPSAPHVTGGATTLHYDANSYSEVLIDVPEDTMTVSFWFRTLDPDAGLFSVMGGGHDRHVFLSGGNIRTRIYTAGVVSSSGLGLADGAWHYVVFTYGPAIGGNKTYVDGVEVISAAKASSDFTWQDRIRFGYSDDASSRMLSGQLDEARLWNRAFTAADVLQNMTNALTGSEAGLIGYWRFNEGTGVMSPDRTPNGRNATFANNPVWTPVNTGFSTPPGVFAQYLLDLDVTDLTPPAITSVTLPAAGSTNTSMIDRFSVGWSRDVNPVLNGLRRDIRSYGGHNYLLTDSTMTWYAAEQQAQNLGGHLTTVNDALENAWLTSTFGPVGSLWIGLTDEAQKGTFLWASGEPLTYTNWNTSLPDYSGNKDYTYLRSDGKWANNTIDTAYRAIIEFSGTDSDNDGLVDAVDTFPNDPFNLFDLRATGPDGLFDTPDDDVYRALAAGSYSVGLNLDFTVADGPLQPGYYRYMVTSSLRDLFGNNMTAPFVRYFTVHNVPGYIVEGRTNNSPTSATFLPLVEDPPSLKTVAGRGNVSNSQQSDYWAFDANAGDWLKVAAQVPGSPAGSALNYRVLRADGSILFTWTSSYNGDGESGVYTLPATGRYLLRVYHDYGYTGEYRFRVTVGSSPLQAESEENGTIATGDPLTFEATATAQSASVAGRVRVPGDLDYYNLGTVSNGFSIFVNVRLPGSSTFSPIVSVYSAAGAYQSEAPGGRGTDGVANVPVTATGTYFAVVRSGDGTAGINEQYLVDVQVVPTGSINFPNLVVSGVFPPAGSGILSGQQITYAYVVANVGNVGTTAANWLDRAVLSQDLILGNGDDIALGFLPHQGVLGQGATYGVTNTFTLPEGISGDFYLIAQTDAGNAINEYLFEGDNVTVSAATFHVEVAPYADLVVEGLNVAGPDESKTYTITWKTANRGTAAAPAGFSERLLVRNQTSGAGLVNSETTSASGLASGTVLPRLHTVVATNAGVYLVQVSLDSKNVIFEYNLSGHAAAEANNTAGTNFQITAYYSVAVQSNPAGAGSVTGAGTYASGAAVTVTATPNTNVLPYRFVNWTEGGSLQSASTNYSFLITRDRVLTANFTLPTFLISATNLPPGSGTVAGQGNYFYGTTNVLTANANFGYTFTNWTENGSVLATTTRFTNVVTSNRFLVANYIEANTAHHVTTGTSPTNVATVEGAGTYTNGQTAAISAPASITNPPNIYNFRQFRLNGALAGNSRTINKTFSTLDPTNMQYIAYYDTISILPLITNIVVSPPGMVPATTNLRLSFQFNRSMDSNFVPVVLLTNASASVQPAVSAGGKWSSTAVSNDTFAPPPVTLSTGMDGATLVYVSGARDLGGGILALTNVAQLMVDVTAPANPVLSLSASNNTSATVTWSGYAPPADLNGFRVYLATNSFASVAGLTAVSSLGSGARNFTYQGLMLDHPYFAAVAAVDAAGNSSPLVTPLPFTLNSAVPPPVPVQVAAAGASSARVSWQGYNTSTLLGFAGFRLYYERTNFSSVAALTPKQSLGASARTAAVEGLDRTTTWYFAVAGYNGNGQFNPNVTTATWTDPYSGNISVNTTIGGPGMTTVDILQNITVANNAVVTIPAGTTLRFAAGTSLRVQGGTLRAEGTALDPIILTAGGGEGSSPAAGDFGGVFLGTGAGNSSLKHVFINYGAGLTVSNCSPVVDAFTALNNTPAGLTLLESGVLNTTNALLAYNDIGARQLGSGLLTIVQSSIKGNGTNALAQGGLTLRGLQNWWGSAVPAEIDALLRGSVEKTGFLTGEPLLTPAIGTANNLSQVGIQSVNLRLACRTADSMRLSEDSTFSSVFFTPITNLITFPLSAGGGQKTVFAQFRSLTAQTSAPVSVTVTYITAGPAISSFNLFEGEILTRPLKVTGAASAPLGMASMEFYVDGIGLGTNAGGTLSHWFDPRTLSSDVHRVQLVARDNSGNIAVAALNVTVIPTPPPSPFISSPATDLAVSSNSVLVAGSAEPFITVRLYRSGSLAGLTNASQDGAFSFAGVPLLEGRNEFTAVAVDPLGTASSSVRTVTLDTIPPASLVMDTPAYTPGSGLLLTWRYPTTGKRAATFQVFWSTAPISSIDQATGHTIVLSTMSTLVQGLATANYYFYVVGYDALGNPSPLSAPVQYLYDAVPPAFSVAYDKPSPVGASKVHVVINASKPLARIPTLTVQPYGAAPALLPLASTSVNTYEADINVNAQWASGPVQMKLTAADLAGNSFSGPPSGPPLVVDVTAPSAVIATAPSAPVQTTNTTSVTVSLQLTEPPQAGATPQLNFGPPVGAPVPVALTGSGTNWLGNFNVTPAMGSGIGHFTFTAADALGNVGHLITSGTDLELYNTELPTAPGQPVRFQAESLAGGLIELTWSNVPNAEIYRVYSDPGTNLFEIPSTLLADNITSNSFVDLPSADGSYRYVVTASRRGAEGTNSIVRVAISDRTGPPAPTNVVVQLVATGLQVGWEAGAGEQPYRYYVYRHGTRIRTTATATPIIDNPPRGIMTYTVAAVDALGNETLSAGANFQLLVSAVNNLQALVSSGQAPQLTWSSPDPTAVGFNVYRNGAKQNTALLTAASFTDAFPPGANPVTYAVTAVNATNAESAARSVMVYAADIDLLVNAEGGTSTGSPVTTYFDDYKVLVSNYTAGASLPLAQVEVLRQVQGQGSPLTLVTQAGTDVGTGNFYELNLAVPSASVIAPQTVRVRAVQQTGIEGSTVIYQESFSFPTVQSSATTVEVSVNVPPLAGGLTDFNLKVYNRGFKPMYFVATRQNGAKPGDVYIGVRNPVDQEVSRTEFSGVPNGVIFYGDVGYLMVPPGASTSFVVKDVFVPESLASNIVTFQAVVGAIYDRVSPAGQQRSGPLSGSMLSALSQTPYYGTAQTDHLLYSNSQPVVITGQALDRATGQPVPNVPLKLGFATRGYSWNSSATTDASGNYTYIYNVQPGLAGSLMLWAAHPDIYDQLNQAQIQVYRLYVGPESGDIRMSKNDTLPFRVGLLNPADVPLTGFTVSFQAYQVDGTNRVPISTIQGEGLLGNSFALAPGERQQISLRLIAAPDAPDNAIGVFTIASEQGATATFTGYLTLLPAVPLITVTDPNVGYVETSLDRGALLSRQVTVVNRGLKDLLGVRILPPTNINWMAVNLPAAADGSIPLPDLLVGQSNTFTVVFTPPADTVLGFYQDKLTLRGTNAQSSFDVNLYARVTSASKGAVQFYVDNILGLVVPNATVRLRNTALSTELPPVYTDLNGLVTVTNLQEGEWSWQISAPGHSPNVGLANVIPAQTVNVSTRLNKSVVTVNFTVTPVPFTDRYEITIEQTFETHVPMPVLVLTPVHRHFEEVTPGFQASFIVTAKNEGLIQMTDVTFTGTQDSTGSFTPLITYLPALLPQQSVEIPFTFTYTGTNAPGRQGAGSAIASCSGMPNMDAIAGFIDGMNAFANAFAQCASDRQLIALAATVAVTYAVVTSIQKGAKAIAGALQGGLGLAKYLGCILGKLIGPIAGIGIPLAIQTAPLNQSTPQFVPIQAGCFAPGTGVLLADGASRPIEKIKPGDVLKSGSRGETATVGEVFERRENALREIVFALPGQAQPGGQSGSDLLRTTDEHLFWEDGRGWVAASELQPGRWLINQHGRRVQIISNHRVPGSHQVYTLKLRGDTAFYANGILVHDLCGAWNSSPDPAGEGSPPAVGKRTAEEAAQ